MEGKNHKRKRSKLFYGVSNPMLCFKSDSKRKTRMNEVTIMDLPRVIMVKILSRLTIKPIFRCKTVCKLWYHLLTSDPNMYYTNFPCILLSGGYSNPSLLELNADYDYCSRPGNRPIELSTKFHLPPLKSPMFVVGSCNGFICLLNCLRYEKNRYVYVNNPLLGEYFKLRLPEREKGVLHVGYGFCFSEAYGKYKVLRLVVRKFHRDSPQVSELEIYTLGVDEKWRNLGQVPFPLWNHTWPRFDNAYVNGALHWMSLEKNNSICSFDIGTEKLKSLPAPPGLGTSSSSLRLAELGNCLCLTDYIYRKSVDIWQMKEYGVAESWTKKDSILVDSFPPDMAEYICEAIVIWKDGEILMRSGTQLASYNPKEDKCKEVNVYGYGTMTRYIPSFYSLKTVMGDNFQVSYVYSEPQII